MYRLAYMILENEDDASDAVQMAMTRIWEHRDSMQEIGNLTAYCISAARYAAIDIARSRKPSDRLSEADALAASDSTEIARITGLSDANVRTLLSRARTKLRLLYSQQQ